MDDIYISKKKSRESDEIEIPAINIPDITPPPNENRRPAGYGTPERDGFAPYRGKEKPKNRNKGVAPEPVHNDKPKKKKKEAGPVKRIAMFLILVFAALYLLTAGAAAVSGYKKTSLNRNSYIASSQLNSSPFVKNILLIGVDGTDNEEQLRSDSMILVSLDTVHAKIKITSFMRDSWLQIPGHKFAKLNAACSLGGAQLVVDTIEYNFRVNINDYVLVDFAMFTEIIDAIGGVNVEVTPAEANFINRTTRHTVESGESIHLDGAKALVYCRIRKLDSDYMRTYRQRKVINAILAKIKGPEALRLFGAMFGIFSKIQTNMNPFEIACLIYRTGFSALFFDTVSSRIPTDDLSWSGREGSQSVVELDVGANSDYLYNFIYTGSAESSDGGD